MNGLGVFLILAGALFTAIGAYTYRNASTVSERAQRDAVFQPQWAVKRWTPGNARARGVSLLIGGPTFVVIGVLVLAGLVQTKS